MGRRTTTAAAALLLALQGLLVCASAQNATCGTAGAPCCCKGSDWQNGKCCGDGLQCTMFAGQGFGIPATIENACLPRAAPAGCGAAGGACCLGTNSKGYVQATCGSGLSCIPSSSAPTGSKAQLQRLNTGLAAAVNSPAVAGVCKAFAAADCGKPFMPCGKDAAGVTCPGGSAACAAGHYCASAVDAIVGERCLPLPADAGKAGGPCLPNNLPNAPVVDPKKTGKKTAPPFCTGSAICFTSLAGDTTGFTHDMPERAKSLAARITGTKCLEVPADCGQDGKSCCPSDFKAITDKPLPSYGTAWAGSPCNDKLDKNGAYCIGSYAFLASQPLGTCKRNAPCGAVDQPCCRYSQPGMSGLSCPFLGKPGAGYCTLQGKCRICPTTLYLIEDLMRCY